MPKEKIMKDVILNNLGLIVERKLIAPLSDFKWVNEDALYLYAEIKPNGAGDVVCVKVPYKPINKPIKLKTKGADSFLPLIFEGEEVKAPTLPLVSDEMCFSLKSDGEFFNLEGAYLEDFKVGDCVKQNADFLLLCEQGSNYRYPLMGVGIGQYINSPEHELDLSRTLKEVFSEDKMQVDSAKYTPENKELHLELSTIKQ